MRLAVASLVPTRTIHRASRDIFGRLAARPARLLLCTVRAQQKAFIRITSATLILLMSSLAWPATPPGTSINNTATANYSIGATPLTGTSTASVNTAACIAVGVKIELLQYVPPARAAFAPPTASNVMVQTSAYSPSGSLTGPFVPLANPTLLGNAAPTPLPANLLLAPLSNPTAAYTRNEPVFVRVTSYDANINPASTDTLAITLTTSSGDSIVVQLLETGLSTGIFVGAVPTNTGAAPVINDGNITASSPNETITGTYTHSDCLTAALITSTSSALIDPYGIVFDSSTGAAINGATIQLVDTSNNPVTVYCDDGVTVLQPILPATAITSGSPTTCDATMIAGGFRFPQVPAGNFKFIVTPPAGVAFPSSVAAASLPATIGTPAVAPTIWGNPGATPGGSYGGTFSLWGPALKIDLPVDSGISVMNIQKTAGKSVVGTGEFVPYTLSITNNTAAPLTNALIADRLPQGFRYQKGSSRLNGMAVPDPAISADARTLTFNLNIAASSTISVLYVVEVTPAAHTGTADNTAAGTGGFTSNTAHASVVVREDLYRNKSFLIGRVIDGSCDDKVDNDAIGLANARIVMENGTYILTDKEGRWHIDNVRPGTHVVQLDLDSLPKDYEVVACENNTRFAGSSYSQFVNLQPGTLWRADFHVKKKVPVAPRLTQALSAQQNGDLTIVTLALDSETEVTGYSATIMLPEYGSYRPGSAKLNGKPTEEPMVADRALIFRSKAQTGNWKDKYTFEMENIAPRSTFKSLVRFTPLGRAAQNTPVAQVDMINHAPATAETSADVIAEAADLKPAKTPQDGPLLEKMPYDDIWLASAQPGIEWLYPRDNYFPALPTTKIAIKHAPDQHAEVMLNGQLVSEFNYDGTAVNSSHKVALSTWRGIGLKDGANQISIRVLDANGTVMKEEQRVIRYINSFDHVELDKEHSRLIADGKTRPIIAVRFLDKDGYPVRPGVNGEFMLNEPYQSYDRLEGIDREPLTGRIGGKPMFEVKGDGLAMIELEPTTQTGEAIVSFPFKAQPNDQHNMEIRAWLEPGQRDWILVGFGEGTIGQKTLSGNIQALKDANVDDQLYDGNKLAFYAKGTIRGDYLMTIAYDTAKDTGANVLKQAVDPTQYYTLYADATQANHDAASSSRLYVKLERKQFYAMFGDYDTGLTVTELSRYSRTLNGVKSEYKGEKAGYSVFASTTSQAFVKDEIPGNGTSGIYKLSRGNLMINSDKVRIETRDRFQSQNIVSTQSLTRYLDYDIDYSNGTLSFRMPINVRDGSFNPIYIVAEYESADPADEKATFGGRGHFKPTEKIEVGATVVHEGTVGATGNLTGVDATYQVDDKNKIRAEVATTDRELVNVPSKGNAWLGEVTHHEDKWDARAYIREQESGFGMGQQAASEIATRKLGADGRVKLSEKAELRAQAWQQQNLTNNAENDVVEGRVDNRIDDSLSAYYGGRITRDQDGAGTTTQNNQLLGGANYTMLNKRLSLHTAAEVSGSSADTSTMPNRLIVGSDYKVTEKSKLFAEQEFARGNMISANTTSAGIRTQPWTGNEMSASVGSNYTNDSERIYSNLGMVQAWQIDEHWQTNFSVDHSHTLHNSATPLTPNTPLPSGTMPPAPGYTGDYTAASTSLGYHEKIWSCDGRIEIRNSSFDQQRNLQLGAQRQLDQGRNLAAGYTLRLTDGPASNTRYTDLRFSYAYRPNDSRWIWFDRIDYITQSSQAVAYTLDGTKLVNNINANYMPSRRTQISMQYGAKYVKDTIESTDYKGYTDLIGTEIRHDLTSRWDIGAFGSMMNSHNSGVNSYAYGASVGYKLVKNMWLSAGYNIRGMNDRDFANASYRAKGPYITLRMKVDQDTFGLNKGKEITRPITTE